MQKTLKELHEKFLKSKTKCWKKNPGKDPNRCSVKKNIEETFDILEKFYNDIYIISTNNFSWNSVDDTRKVSNEFF